MRSTKILIASTLLVFSTIPSVTKAQVLESDSLALVALYNSTDGANWNTPWDLSSPVSTWSGVTLSAGRVTGLALGSNNLVGTIPPALGDLTSLNVMSLAINQLTGSIPFELGNLINLTGLYLRSNQLSGSIPAELGNLTALSELYLFDNQLSGSIPLELGSLTALNDLYLYDNQLSGTIPAELGELTNLGDLFLHTNQLSGAVPPELGNLSTLSRLKIYSNQLSALPDLSVITGLSTLSVESNRLDFGDLEYNVGFVSFSFTYSPQDSVGTAATVIVAEGADYTLHAPDVGGTSTIYAWYKDDVLISGATSDTLLLASVAQSDAADYTMRATNTVVTGLTLQGRPINLSVNDAPVITSSATATGTEDVAFLYTATATDAEGDDLTFTFSALSSWLTSDGDSVTGTPTEGETAGSFRVIVSDGSLFDTLDVSITVAAVNDAPVITSSATARGFEDVSFSYTATATDAEDDALAFSFSNVSSWLLASGATVSGTPTEGEGSGSFRVTVSDGSLEDTLDVSVTVSAFNDTILTGLKIIASDGAADDLFGYSVSVSGDYAFVGAQGDDDNGDASGSVYIFKRTGMTWAQEAKLLASDAAAGDQFGHSVSISGDYAILGAWLDDDNGTNSGSAYIFKRTDTTWAQEAKLLSSDVAASEHFGFSVSIDSNYAVVGAKSDFNANGSVAGSAYIFKRTGTTWASEAKLLASDGAGFDRFGTSVSIDSNYVVVAAPFDDDNGDGSGSAYIFKRSGTTWAEEAKLLPSDGATEDSFGGSVSISGDYAVLGAVGDDDAGSVSGSAYIFKRNGTSWAEEAKLLPADGAINANFGVSVSISGDSAIVGAQFEDANGTNSGSAYIFKRTATTWEQEAKLLPSDGESGDRFGYSVSISRDYAVVGAWRNDDNGSSSGSAYLFSLNNTAPVITSSATASGTEDAPFSYTATATDAENDALTFTFSNLSTWLSAIGATVSGTPTEGVTSGSFRVIVSDGTLKDTLDVTITINNVNDAPVLSDLPDVVFNEDETAVVHLSDWFALVDDPDNADSTLEWSLESGVGDSVSFVIQGDSVIFEAPQDWFAFNRDTLKVRVSDGSLTDSTRLAVHIMPVNDAPMFVDFPDSLVLEFGESDTLILSDYAFDIDDPDSVLTYEDFACVAVDSILCVTAIADTAFINPVGNFSGMADFEFFVTDTSGASDTVSIVIYVKMAVGIANEGLIPQEYSLSNNYPNPFNPQTTISYGLPKPSNLSLIIYNLMGQEIMRWDEQNSLPGFYEKIWNGRNKFGVSVGSGVYFYRIIAGDFVQTKKMVLLK